MAMVGGIIGSFAGGPSVRSAAAAEAQNADLAVLNATVYTVDAQVPKAEAFALKTGRFTAVGTHRRHPWAHRQGDPAVRCPADDDRKTR